MVVRSKKLTRNRSKKIVDRRFGKLTGNSTKLMDEGKD